MTYKEAREKAGIVSSAMMAKLMGVSLMSVRLRRCQLIWP